MSTHYHPVNSQPEHLDVEVDYQSDVEVKEPQIGQYLSLVYWKHPPN
jgi:hypothetical protein